MSIIQDSLKKAEGNYLKKRIFDERQPDTQKIMPAKENKGSKIGAVQETEKKPSMRFPVLVGILTTLLIVYGLQSSLSFFKNNERSKVPYTKDSAPAARPSEQPAKAGLKSLNPLPARAPVFVLNGIMYIEKKPQAIINGYVLEEGDKINGATVLIIEKDFVLLDLNDTNIKLEMSKNY